MGAQSGPRGLVWIAVAFCAVSAALAVAAEFRRPLNPDAAWLLYCAEAMLRGERLYVDLLEVNPPLIVWLNLPVAALGRAFAVSDIGLFRGAILLAVAASSLTCGALGAQFPGAQVSRPRWAVAAASMFALLPLVGGAFGQREHIALALLLPSLLLAALRIAGGSIPAAAALALGAAGAIGLALKPHYAVVWLLVVGVRIVAAQQGTRRWHVEDVVVVAAGILYPVTVFLVTPEYFQLIAGVARDYLSYGARPLQYVLLTDSPATWFYVAVAAWLVLDRHPGRNPLAAILLAAGCGFLVAVVAQHKGWSYHYVPLTACAFLLALATLWPLTASDRPLVATRGIGWVLYAVLATAFAGALTAAVFDRATGPLSPREVRQVAVRDAVQRQPNARTVLVLSSQLRDAFPLVNETGLRWTGGYPNMWLSLVYYPVAPAQPRRMALRTPEAMSPGERAAFERTTRDLVAGRPDLLIVESRGLNERRTNFPGGFDFLAYVAQDPRAAAALSAYRLESTIDGMQILRRGVTLEAR